MIYLTNKWDCGISYLYNSSTIYNDKLFEDCYNDYKNMFRMLVKVLQEGPSNNYAKIKLDLHEKIYINSNTSNLKEDDYSVSMLSSNARLIFINRERFGNGRNFEIIDYYYRYKFNNQNNDNHTFITIFILKDFAKNPETEKYELLDLFFTLAERYLNIYLQKTGIPVINDNIYIFKLLSNKIEDAFFIYKFYKTLFKMIYDCTGGIFSSIDELEEYSSTGLKIVTLEKDLSKDLLEAILFIVKKESESEPIIKSEESYLQDITEDNIIEIIYSKLCLKKSNLSFTKNSDVTD
jgi:hypothetical protein